MKTLCLLLLTGYWLLITGCSTPPRASIDYTVPNFDYEQHQPQFTNP